METQDRRGRFASINVTPMADIMIVLLLIFMVVTTMITTGVPMPLPRAANSKKGQPNRVSVALTKSLAMMFNDVAVRDEGDLEARLRGALGILPEGEKVVFLKADPTLLYLDVGRVLAVCHRAGADGVTLLTDKKR